MQGFVCIILDYHAVLRLQAKVNLRACIVFDHSPKEWAITICTTYSNIYKSMVITIIIIIHTYVHMYVCVGGGVTEVLLTDLPVG